MFHATAVCLCLCLILSLSLRRLLPVRFRFLFCRSSIALSQPLRAAHSRTARRRSRPRCTRKQCRRRCFRLPLSFSLLRLPLRSRSLVRSSSLSLSHFPSHLSGSQGKTHTYRAAVSRCSSLSFSLPTPFHFASYLFSTHPSYTSPPFLSFSPSPISLSVQLQRVSIKRG